MAASSSRGRSSLPFQSRKQSTPFSPSNSFMNGRFMLRSVSSSTTSCIRSGSRSTTPSGNPTDFTYSRAHGNRSQVNYPSTEELINEPVDVSRSGDSISVTVRFRPMSEREYQKGDEIAWYADGDKIVHNEYNPATAYAFDKVFGPDTSTQEVYEVAARPVVKAAREGINSTVFAYGVTSSGKTHIMHGDHISPGIIPLAIKDVFSIIQDTPGCEFLLRVSYLEIYNEVINDLLDPTGQNLRVREDNQEGVSMLDQMDLLVEQVKMLAGEIAFSTSTLKRLVEQSINDPESSQTQARMQEMKEKDHKYLGNGDANSHICKVCFESPTAAMLLPCRHFCLCKSCSLACIECPICRTTIADRIFAST